MNGLVPEDVMTQQLRLVFTESSSFTLDDDGQVKLKEYSYHSDSSESDEEYDNEEYDADILPATQYRRRKHLEDRPINHGRATWLNCDRIVQGGGESKERSRGC